MDDDRMTSLKSMARQFLILTATGAIDEAYTRFVADDFVHHNQYFKGDRESLKQAMLANAVAMPNKKIDVKSLVQEGDRIVTYSHVQIPGNAMEIAAFHMFRFGNGKIVELWDSAQVIAQNGPNENGPF